LALYTLPAGITSVKNIIYVLDAALVKFDACIVKELLKFCSTAKANASIAKDSELNINLIAASLCLYFKTAAMKGLRQLLLYSRHYLNSKSLTETLSTRDKARSV